MDYQVNSHLNGAFSRTKLPKKAGKGTPRYALTCNGIQKGQNLARAPAMDQPRPYHRMRHDRSILALVVSPTRIFAGTQGGEILVRICLFSPLYLLCLSVQHGVRLTYLAKVYDLDTFERLTIIEAHSASVLALCLCEDNKILLSSAGDRIVNVINIQTLAE